jgi:hypothetical protein
MGGTGIERERKKGRGKTHPEETWKLQNGRGKEVNDILKDFDELERTSRECHRRPTLSCEV